VAAGGADEAAGADKAGGERAGQEGGAERDDGGGGGGVLGMAGEAARRVHDTAEHLAEKVRARAAGSPPGEQRCACGPSVHHAHPVPVQSPTSWLHDLGTRWQPTGMCSMLRGNWPPRTLQVWHSIAPRCVCPRAGSTRCPVALQAAEEARAVGGYVKAAPARAAHAVAEETRAVGSFVQRAARATASAIMSKL